MKDSSRVFATVLSWMLAVMALTSIVISMINGSTKFLALGLFLSAFGQFFVFFLSRKMKKTAESKTA